MLRNKQWKKPQLYLMTSVYCSYICDGQIGSPVDRGWAHLNTEFMELAGRSRLALAMLSEVTWFSSTWLTGAYFHGNKELQEWACASGLHLLHETLEPWMQGIYCILPEMTGLEVGSFWNFYSSLPTSGDLFTPLGPGKFIYGEPPKAFFLKELTFRT